MAPCSFAQDNARVRAAVTLDGGPHARVTVMNTKKRVPQPLVLVDPGTVWDEPIWPQGHVAVAAAHMAPGFQVSHPQGDPWWPYDLALAGMGLAAIASQDWHHAFEHIRALDHLQQCGIAAIVAYVIWHVRMGVIAIARLFRR